MCNMWILQHGPHCVLTPRKWATNTVNTIWLNTRYMSLNEFWRPGNKQLTQLALSDWTPDTYFPWVIFAYIERKVCLPRRNICCSVHSPVAFMRRNSQMARETPRRLTPTMLFHSPVGAFISENVWQKVARYRAFFSSRVSLLQSPFSFSRSAWQERTRSLECAGEGKTGEVEYGKNIMK